MTDPADPVRDIDLLVVGDCNPDVLVLGDDVRPRFGQQERIVASMSLVIGGSAAITAVAAARLGLRVALVAAVGDDPAGQLMLGQLAAEGVNVTAVAVRPAVPTGMTVALSEGADRAILTATGAITTLTVQPTCRARCWRGPGICTSARISCWSARSGPGLAALFAAARAAGVGTSLDTNWDPSGQWGDDRLRAALAVTDLLLPNEAEVLRLSGQATLAAATAVLTAAGPRLVVKLGARGALCVDGEPGSVTSGLPRCGPSTPPALATASMPG